MSKCVMDRRVWMLVAAAVVVPATVSGQQKADTTPPGLAPYVVGQAKPPVEEGQQMVSMTLDEAIARALKLNLNVQSDRLNPQIQQYNLSSAEGAFTPTFSMNLGYNKSTQLPTSQLNVGATGNQSRSTRYTWNGSLTEPMPWLGSQLSLNFSNSKNTSNLKSNLYNPSFGSSLSLDYTQPLLAGLLADNNRAAVKSQTIQSSITDLQLTAQLANLENQVRQGYWALREAIEGIEIQRRNLAEARELLHQDSLQMRVGQMTSTQTLQALAQVASAEQALLNAQVTWHNQALTFKQLLVSGPSDPLLTQEVIDPTTQPTQKQQQVDIQAAIKVALQDRTDIREQRQQRNISQVNLNVTKSSALPTLNFTAGYSLAGRGGDQYTVSQLLGTPVLTSPGGYTNALNNISSLLAPTWTVGLQGSYPIGPNPNKTRLEAARLQLRQTNLALKNQELTIMTQVTNAGYAVRNAYLQLEAARRASEAAELSFQGEMQRFRVGAATNYEVVQSQNQLTAARLSELQAIVNHENAIATFKLVQHVGAN